MGKRFSNTEFYAEIVAVNEGINRKDVEKVFVWYDLLGCFLPFQIIFILVHALGSGQYAYTMFSALTIIIMDSILKNSLEKDGKNFEKFHQNIPLVKLWVIPLIVMGIVATVAMLMTKFGII